MVIGHQQSCFVVDHALCKQVVLYISVEDFKNIKVENRAFVYDFGVLIVSQGYLYPPVSSVWHFV